MLKYLTKHLVLKKLIISVGVRIFKFLKIKSRFFNINGFQMFLNFLDPVDRLIILHKTYETEEIDILTNLIKDNSIKKFIDIGANCGFYTFKFARQNMEIYSFEPNIDALNKIENTLYKNEYLKNKIKIFPYGISDCNSKLEMVSMIKHGYVQTGGSGVVSSKKPKGNNFKFYEAEFKIGDELLDFQNDNLAIKIDVEGHELNVLKGISNLLKKNKCIVQIEIFKKNFDEINSYLTQKGYYVKDKFEKRSNYFYSNYQ